MIVFSFIKRAKQYVLDTLAKAREGGSGGRFGPNSSGPGSFNDYGSRVITAIQLVD
jgi:hypothetical protein